MLGITLDARAYLARFADEMARLDERAMELWGRLVFRTWLDERTVFVFGNGGSATTATHICEDFGKSSLREDELFQTASKRLRILSLTDNLGWITALGNDLGYAHVFSQQLMSFARPHDLVIAISGSGNSPNVINAVEWANENGLVTFALTGYDGGKLRRLAHHGLHVPLDDMGMVESIHLAAFHWVLNDVYARIHREGRHGNKEGSLDGPPRLIEALDAVPNGLMPA
ncbi:MAG TPA: SIS domain-containing protein [Pirellulales bacterium]|nr:SIS domain-containing protein [Pirellulales bacterium]